MFCPDTATSATFVATNAGSASGTGTMNNMVAPLASTAVVATNFVRARDWTTASNLDIVNEGFLRRLKLTGYTPAVSGGFTNLTVADAVNIGKNSYLTSADLATWNMLLTIRLKDKINIVFAY